MAVSSNVSTAIRRPKIRVTAQLAATDTTFLAKHLRKAFPLIPGQPPLTELTVRLVNDREMSRLHEQFLNIPGPTDVLTFELEHDESGRVTAGDVAVCVPEARRRAKDLGIAPREEMLLYSLHGLLHLCGFDDRTRGDYRRMHAVEDDILTALGIGPTFHRGAAGAD